MAAQKTDVVSNQKLLTDSSDIAADDQPNNGAHSTPAEIRELVQELLKYGYVEESPKPIMFARAIARQRDVQSALEPLDLVLQLDTHRGVAFLAVAESACDDTIEQDEWSHRLIRRQRLTLEQSLLVALLRHVLVLHEQEFGIGQSYARIGLDELLPQFLTYFEDSGSDAKNESRLANLLDQLKTYGVVSEIDKNLEVTIGPLIAHVAGPESLKSLLEVFKKKITSNDSQPADRQLAAPEELSA